MSIIIVGLFTLSLLAFIGYVEGEVYRFSLLKEQPWWIFYVIIFPLVYTLQQRKFELTIEPLNRVDVDKLLEYLKHKNLK